MFQDGAPFIPIKDAHQVHMLKKFFRLEGPQTFRACVHHSGCFFSTGENVRTQLGAIRWHRISGNNCYLCLADSLCYHQILTVKMLAQGGVSLLALVLALDKTDAEVCRERGRTHLSMWVREILSMKKCLRVPSFASSEVGQSQFKKHASLGEEK